MKRTAIAAVFFLAACGGGSSDPPASSATISTSNPPGTASTTPASASSDPATATTHQPQPSPPPIPSPTTNVNVTNTANSSSSSSSASGSAASAGAAGSSTGSTPTTSVFQFEARLIQAPASGSIFLNLAADAPPVLIVEGTNLANVELLPATAYTPIFGRFTIEPGGGRAQLVLDTSVLPIGVAQYRVSAFDAPPGQGGREIVVMPARTWEVKPRVTPEPPAQ